jgi:hypothetical protein
MFQAIWEAYRSGYRWKRVPLRLNEESWKLRMDVRQ